MGPSTRPGRCCIAPAAPQCHPAPATPKTAAGTPATMSTSTSRSGAVALIDALAWKGIWRRIHNIDRFVSELHGLEKLARRHVPRARARLKQGLWGPTAGWNPEALFEVRFLSDTIVVAASVVAP